MENTLLLGAVWFADENLDCESICEALLTADTGAVPYPMAQPFGNGFNIKELLNKFLQLSIRFKQKYRPKRITAMTPSEKIRPAFLDQPESRRLEFKENFPKGEQVARNAVAFAKGAGGKIVFGVKDAPREVVGIPDDQLFSLEESGWGPPSARSIVRTAGNTRWKPSGKPWSTPSFIYPLFPKPAGGFTRG